MKNILMGLSGVLFMGLFSFAIAQTGMAGETHGYGGMGGYAGLWVVYGLIKTGVVVFGLWLLLRLTRAVERIAASKS